MSIKLALIDDLYSLQEVLSQETIDRDEATLIIQSALLNAQIAMTEEPLEEIEVSIRIPHRID